MIWEILLIGAALVVVYFVGGWVENRRMTRAAADAEAAGGPRPTVPK